MGLSLVFILLAVGIVMVLSLPTVQTQLVLRLTKSLQEKTKANLDIAKIKIDLLGNINFSGVVGIDHRADTLFFIDHFQARLAEANEALNGNIIFEAAKMEGFDLRLRQYEGDSLTNLEIFIQKLGQNASDPNTSVAFKTNKLFFSKGKINIRSPQFQLDNINLNELQFELKELNISPQKVSGHVSDLSFMSPEWGEVQSFNASVLKTASELRVDSFSLRTVRSQLKGRTQIDLNPKRQEVEKMRISLLAEQLDPKEWGFKKYYPFPVQTKISGSGNLYDFKIDTLQVVSENVELEAAARIQFEADRKNVQFALAIDSLLLRSDALKSMAQQEILPSTYLNSNDDLKLFYAGEIFFAKNRIQIEGQFRQKNGILNIVTTLPLDLTGQDKFALQLQAKDWEVQDLFVHFPIHSFTGKIGLTGIQANKKLETMDWEAAIDYLSIDNQRFNKLSSEGSLSKGIWEGQFRVGDNRLDVAAQFMLHTDNPLLVNKVHLEAQNIDLEIFHSFSDLGNASLKGTVDARFTELDLNKINGNFKFSNWSLNDMREVVRFDDFSLEAHTKNKYRTLSIRQSDFLEGSIRGIFQLTDLGLLMKNTLSRAYPFAFEHKFEEPQNALVDITIAQKALNAAFPEWNIEKDFTINGLLHTAPDKGRLQISAPLLKYKKSLFQGLELKLNPVTQNNTNSFSANRLVYNNYEFEDVALSSQDTKEGLLLQISARGGNQRNDTFNLKALHTIVPEKELRFDLLPSSIRFKSNDWLLSQATANPSRFTYQLKNQTIAVEDFSAQSGQQKIIGSGYFSSDQAYEFQANLDAVILSGILPDIKNFDIEGFMTSKLQFTRSAEKNELDLSVTVDELSLNNEMMGTLKILGTGNTQLGTYTTSLEVQKQLQKTLIARGTLQNSNLEPNLNLDITFNDFQINFLNPLAKGSLDEITGLVKGNAFLWGPVSDLSHDGQLQLSQAGLIIPYLNTAYRFGEAKVLLTQQNFSFLQVPFTDTQFDTQGTLSGKFSHQNFNNWTLDFDLNSDNLLVFNIQETPERVFYGQGFFGGKGNLSGPTKSLLLTLDGQTEKGTNIKVPWTDDFGLVDTSFIDFVGKENQNNFSQEEKTSVNKKKPFEMDFELDVTNDATIEIVIDPESNSSLSGKGVGTLLMEINTEDKFNMWGDFLTTEGTYNFKNLGVIDKKFSLKPGGSVSWEGDPLGAQMNMEAVYSVPGGANPALLLDNPNFNRKIPTEVSIQLQGNLLQPDDPKFSIQFPNTNNLVVSEINYRLADPQRSQLQAISLLSQGVFISDVSVSVQGITNNLYEKASDVLSSLLGERDEKLKVGVNYLQGEKNNELAIETEDRLGLTLSTQLSDKILINGKIGVPVGGIVQTQVVGDVQIDFILNEDGSLRAKVFNKENEFRYIGQDFGYTQGMGLSYNVDFNNFRDLLQKIKKRAVKDSLQASKIQNKTTDLIQFRNKN